MAELPKRWKELQSSLQDAKSKRAQHEPAWRQYLKEYSHRPETGASASPAKTPQTGMAFSTVEIMVAAGFVEQPKIMVRPRRRAEITGAKIVEAVLDYWWDKFKIQDAVMKADRDAKIYGHGWLKTIWRHSSKTGRQINPPVEMVDDMVAQVEAGIQSGALVAEAAPTRTDVINYLRKQLAQIAYDEPLVTRISPWDVWIDPVVTDWEQRRWVNQRYWRRLEDVRSDRSLNNGRFDVEPMSFEQLGPSDSIVSMGGEFRTDNSAMLRVEIHELWDMEEERLYISTPSVEKPLYADDWPNAIGQPFTFLACYDVSDQFYPAGVIERLGSKIWEIDDIRREQMLARRRQHQQYLMRKRHQSQQLKKILESGIDGAIALLEDSQEPLKEILFPIPVAPVNPELYRQDALLEGEAMKELGVTEFMRGYSDKVQTATEVDTINRYGTARTASMHNQVRKAMVDVARHLVGLAQENMTAEDAIRVVGKPEYQQWYKANPEAFMDGEEMVVPFGRRDIQGEFDFKITPASSQSDSEQLRRQQFMSFAQVALPLPFVNGPEVVKAIADLLGIVDPARFVKSPEQIQQEQMMAAIGQGAGGPGGPPMPPGTGSPPAPPGIPSPANSGVAQPGTGPTAQPNSVAAANGRANQ